MRNIILGFHAIQTRLRLDAQSLRAVYYDPARRDRRMGDFLKQAAPLLGDRLHSATQ